MSLRVSLFATCIGDAFFADATADAVRLLRHLGVEVAYPAGQTCCGQPAYNAGHMAEARRAAEHTVQIFTDADYVVLPSGSCAGMLRAIYPKLLGTTADALATGEVASLAEVVSRVRRIPRDRNLIGARNAATARLAPPAPCTPALRAVWIEDRGRWADVRTAPAVTEARYNRGHSA